MRTRLALTMAAVALSASACAADGAYNGGLAYGYGPASSYGYDCNPYGYGAYGYGGYGLGDCGWYGGYFYPGFGNFVFDRDHHRHEMTMGQRGQFTRQGRGPGGEPRVGLGSSGGAIPRSMPQQSFPTGGRMGSGFSGGHGFHGGGRHG
jgi:hypothetical protein